MPPQGSSDAWIGNEPSTWELSDLQYLALREDDPGGQAIESDVLSSSYNGVAHNSAVYDPSSSFSESELISEALLSLQGVRSAVHKLEKLSKVFSLQPADRNYPNLSTLWTRSASTSAVAKVLYAFSHAGTLRYELEDFVDFFLNKEAAGRGRRHLEDNGSKQRKKDARKKKNKLEEADIHMGSSLEESGHLSGLLNQAFAAAVKTILQGHSASADTLTASIRHRRLCGKVPLSDVDGQCAGPLLTYGYGDITLLELYLHTAELRVQLEALAAICLIRPKHAESTESTSGKGMERGTGQGPRQREPFIGNSSYFPKGADLLTYLYSSLLGPDPLHAGVLRFLFARTYQPYAIFIHSWLYHARVVDPYKEFIVDTLHSSLEVCSGIHVPTFITGVSVPLLHAGQQLQVLLQLPESHNFAKQLASLSFLTAGREVGIEVPDAFSSDFLPPRSKQILIFNKRKLNEMMIERDLRIKSATQQFESFFAVNANENNLEADPTSAAEELANNMNCSITKDDLTMGNSDIYEVQPFCLEVEQVVTEPVVRTMDEMKCQIRENLAEDLKNLGQLDLRESQVIEAQKNLENIVVTDTDCNEPFFLGMYKLAIEPTEESMLDYHVDLNGDDDESARCGIYSADKGSCNSCIVDYEMGNHWPNSGLPENPFLSIVSHRPQPSHEYTYTVFTGVDSCWDIALNHANEHDVQETLVPELASISDFRVPNSLNVSPKDQNRLRVGLGFSLNRFMQKSVIINEVGHPVSGNLISLATAGTVLESNQASQIFTGGDIKRLDSTSGNASGGAEWVRSLKMSNEQVTDYGQNLFDCEGDEEIPISIVVDRCIVQEILSQYYIVSKFTLRLLQEKLGLHDHYLALRRYYFMEVGDWADNFVTGLFQHKWDPTEGQQRQLQLQGIFEAALQQSCCAGDKFAERLYINGSSSDNSISLPLLIDCNRLHAFDFISLDYHADWPINLILTLDSIKSYQRIFSLLLQVKLAMYALRDICNMLQSVGRLSENMKYRAGDGCFRAVHFFRHEIGHFVSSFQRYVQTQLLYVAWSKFNYSIQHEVKDMQDLAAIHSAYLDSALEKCFLSLESREIKLCIERALQCILDFRSCLKAASRGGNDSLVITLSGELQAQVSSHANTFRSMMRQLYSYYLKADPDQRALLADLWTNIDFNGFIAATCSR